MSGMPSGAANTKLWTRVQIRHLLILVPLVLVSIEATRPIRDNSFLWHVRAGAEQLAGGEVLTADPFSFTLFGESWRTQSWLVELGYGWMESRFGGLGFVPLMLAAVVTLTYAFAALAIYRETKSPHTVAVWTIVLAWLSVSAFAPRPVVFSFLFLALAVVIARTPAVWWMVAPLLWIWAASHGSWVIGVGLLILESIRQRSSRLAQMTAVGVLLATFTAHGLGVWQVLYEFLANRGALDLIQEWQPPGFSDVLYFPYLIVIGGVILAAARGKLTPRDLIVVVPFLLFGLTSRRAVYPAAIVVIPFASLAWIPAVKSKASPRIVVWTVLLALTALFILPLVMRPAQIDEDMFPTDEAIAVLADRTVFQSDAVGGYRIWRDWPSELVFLDDRAELYGEIFISRYLDAVAGDYGDLFAEYEIDAVLGSTDWPLVRVLGRDGWEEAYRDDHFVVLLAR